MIVAVVGTPEIEVVVKSAGLTCDAEALVEFQPALPIPLNVERVTVDTLKTVCVRVMRVVLVTSALAKESNMDV